MSFTDSPLQAAKDRLPIPVLWQLLNLPGKPGRTCFCPFHENTKTEAGSVFEHSGEILFKCHAGCTDKAVDSPGFLALHLGTSNEDACRKLIEMAGVLPHPNERKSLANPIRSHGRDDACPATIKNGSRRQLKSWVFTWLNMGRQVVVGRAFHRLLA